MYHRNKQIEIMETIYNETLNATKKYNTEKRMWQYITDNNQVILTCKTEKGLDSCFTKYIKNFI